MSNHENISKLHAQETSKKCDDCGELDCNCKDFIHAHQTMMIHPDKYKLEYFPVDGQQLREMRETLLTDCLETQCELEYQLYKIKKRWAEDSDLAHFVNSSRERQQMFWAFNRKGFANGWTVSMMSEYLDRDVSATSKDLSLMQKKQFIYRNSKEGFQRYYLPSERIINNGKYFVEHYVDLTNSLTEFPERNAFFQYRLAERHAFKKVVDPTS
jgi:hypothetical protein|tara:strand:- start:62 stop:700 length:639 start_codon:yes stop_codon:yes gene_type:complete